MKASRASMTFSRAATGKLCPAPSNLAKVLFGRVAALYWLSQLFK